MAVDDVQIAKLEHAARTARRAVALALVATVVMVLVLIVDQSIKRTILDEAQRARGLLDDLKRVILSEVVNGAGTDAAASGPAGDVGHAVADPAGTPAAPDPDASHPYFGQGDRPGSPPGRPRGHG